MVRGKAVLVGPDNVEDRYPTPFYKLFPRRQVDHGRSRNPREYRANHFGPRFPVCRRPFGPGIWRCCWVASMTVGPIVSLAVGGTTALGRRRIIGVAGGNADAISRRLGSLGSRGRVVLAMLLVATIVYRFAAAERRRDLFRRAISLFVGKKLAASLDEAENIALSGTRQNVTILFTDIRGFTAFCEEKDPALVVDLLNDYMRTMVAIVVKYQGHVNKFIGDGILAVFSDDDGSAPGDHPVRAVRCATEMVAAPGRFQTGAGLHTGTVVVGNVGSQDKMEYTVLGDTVNLASRLESLNKENKTSLLMSGATPRSSG